MVRVSAKRPFLHHFLQILIGRGDYTHINLKGAAAFQTLELNIAGAESPSRCRGMLGPQR